MLPVCGMYTTHTYLLMVMQPYFFLRMCGPVHTDYSSRPTTLWATRPDIAGFLAQRTMHKDLLVFETLAQHLRLSPHTFYNNLNKILQ